MKTKIQFALISSILFGIAVGIITKDIIIGTLIALAVFTTIGSISIKEN